MPDLDSTEPGAHEEARPARETRPFLEGMLVLASALVPYLSSLRFDFVYDDDGQVLTNPGITSWHYVPAYFTEPIAGFFHGVTSAHYYRPLFFLWLRLNYFAWGPHPRGWHAANLSLHAAASLLVFSVLRRYFADRRWAALGAMLFAVHPAHVETVAWVSGCTDSLLAVSLLGSLLLWMKNREVPSRACRLGSLACCALALLTKETAIILPALVFAHAYFQVPAGREKSQPLLTSALRTVLPYALVAALFLAVRHRILLGLPGNPMWVWPSHALLTIPSLILFYLGHLVWPVNLGLYYDVPVVAHPTSPLLWLSLLVLALIACAGFLLARRTHDPRLPVAGLWFLLPLAPVLYIPVFQRDDFAHDRYLYLPVLAVSILLGCFCEFAAKRWVPTSAWPSLAAAGMILLLGALAFAETRPWQNNLTLYQNAVRVSPKHVLARNNLAREYAQLQRFDEAAALLENLLKDRPDLWLANYNYGFVNYRLGHLAVAENYLGRAIVLDPKEADEHLYLGATYLKEGRLAAAEAQLRTALALDPSGHAYHYTLAVVYLRQNRIADARDEMLEELRYHPENSLVRGQLDAVNRLLANGPG